MIDLKNLLISSKIFISFFFNRKKLNKIKNKIIINKELSIYWQLISENWYEAFYSSPSFISISYSIFFNKILKNKNFVKNVYFNFENQNFEKMINYEAYNTSIKTFGIVNTSVRFWDFRFFNLKKNEIFTRLYYYK